MPTSEIDPLLEKWVWRIHHREPGPDSLHEAVAALIAEVREDERANAARVCKAQADAYLAKGELVGWKLNATGALASMDRIAAGERVPEPPKEGG